MSVIFKQKKKSTTIQAQDFLQDCIYYLSHFSHFDMIQIILDILLTTSPNMFHCVSLCFSVHSACCISCPVNLVDLLLQRWWRTHGKCQTRRERVMTFQSLALIKMRSGHIYYYTRSNLHLHFLSAPSLVSLLKENNIEKLLLSVRIKTHTHTHTSARQHVVQWVHKVCLVTVYVIVFF